MASMPGGGADRTCMFWKLPHEVRDMIYTLVYGERQKIRPIDRGYWEDIEGDERGYDGEDYVPTDFPESMFASMLVSTQYLKEAALVFMKTITFEFDSTRKFRRYVSSGNLFERLMAQYLTNVDITNFYDHDGGILCALPHLSHLRIQFSSAAFERKGSIVTWLNDYTDTDLFKADAMRDLLKIRGLRTVSVIHEGGDRERTPKERRKWLELEKRIEVLLRRETCKPRQSSSLKPSLTSVYQDLILPPRSAALQPTTMSIGNTTSTTMVALTDQDIPDDADEFVKLFCDRPRDVFDWVQDARRLKISQ